jgi:hypothetical protein
MKVALVDGSTFEDVRLISPATMRLATLAGIQDIPFQVSKIFTRKPSEPRYEDEVQFQSPTIHEVTRLRGELQKALDQNAASITQLIGPNILQQFFNVPSI